MANELRIDAALLEKLAKTVAGASVALQFEGWKHESPEEALQSSTVAAALSSGTSEQVMRAGLAEAKVTEAGIFPSEAAEAFLEMDARLAKDPR